MAKKSQFFTYHRTRAVIYATFQNGEVGRADRDRSHMKTTKAKIIREKEPKTSTTTLTQKKRRSNRQNHRVNLVSLLLCI